MTRTDALDLEPGGLSRRRFLLATLFGVGGGAVLAGSRLDLPGAAGARAWAAPPVAPTDGIVVNVFMYGGNDSLNTVVPLADADYLRYRGGLAVGADQALPLDATFGLHPNLGYLKELYDAGNVAVVHGIGLPLEDLSHFSAQDRWMTGLPTSLGTSGWLGRWLDGRDDYDALRMLTLGTSVPLSVVGARRRAAAVPDQLDGFGAGTRVSDGYLYDAVRKFSAGSPERGSWHGAIAATQAAHLDVVGGIAPVYDTGLPAGGITRKMALAARLINADIGTRVIDTGWGDFDSHRDQLTMHPLRMAEFDAALRAFYTTLSPARRGQVVVLVTSEFGRTPWANGAAGTDHGSSGISFVIGEAVRGGMHGAPADLASMGRWDRTVVTTDYRALYADVLQNWLGADPVEVLGGAFPGVAVLDAPAATPTPDPGETPTTVPSVPIVSPAPTVPPPAPVPLGGDFIAVSPVRIVDTRTGLGVARSPLGAGGDPRRLPVLGVGGIPTDGVTAVAVNVTATNTSADSYLTVWPSGEGRPDASSLNWTAGRSVPNLVVCRPGPDGTISAWNAFGVTDLLTDVVGYFRASGTDRLLPISPFRLLDTRNGIGARRGPLEAGQTLPLTVTGVAGSAVPATGVDAVVLNVTVDGPTKPSYLGIWPDGSDRPEVSSLNFVAGQTVPNLVIAKVGAGGRIQLFNEAGSVHVIADVVGCFAAEGLGSHFAVTPTRVLDTRVGTGVARAGAVGTASIRLPLAGTGPVPAGATGAIVNVTVTGPSATSYLTVWPSREARPTVSSLNYTRDLTVANLVVVKLGTDGAVELANAFGTAHVIGDVVGYFA